MGHECRSYHLGATHRIFAAQRISEMRRPIQWRRKLARLLLLGSISGDGLRAMDLPRESARHRGLPGGHGREARSHGLSRPGPAFHPGRCQRHARLAHGRRLRADPDCHCTAALCRRTDGCRTRSKPLCAGFDDHRLMPEFVSLGSLPAPQGRRQDAYAARSARQHPHLHPHRRRQAA